ncbi:MAG: hypothetical protein M1839_000005 [Geoglossum umbratile]|nr:MAG: hypothetical protein M1839_000005 [Geoglossum umbratile]
MCITVMLFAINAIFSQRIMRAVHPNFGWNKYLGWFFVFFYTSIIIVVSMNITSLVTYHYTLNPSVMLKCRNIQLFGICWYTFLAIFPLFFVPIGCAVPASTQVEKFGTGRFRSKAMLVCLASFILTIGTSFRMITAFFERPITQPAWFHSKACFYGFIFTVEIIVIIVYGIVRVDRRFHVPDGSKRPGDYSSVNLHKTDRDSYMWGEEIFECPSCSQRTSMRSSLVISRTNRTSSFNGSQLHISSRPRSQSGTSGPPVPASPLHNTSSPLAQEAPLLPSSPPLNQGDWAEVPGIALSDGQPQQPVPLAHGQQQHNDRIEFAPPQRSSP